MVLFTNPVSRECSFDDNIYKGADSTPPRPWHSCGTKVLTFLSESWPSQLSGFLVEIDTSVKKWFSGANKMRKWGILKIMKNAWFWGILDFTSHISWKGAQNVARWLPLEPRELKLAYGVYVGCWQFFKPVVGSNDSGNVGTAGKVVNHTLPDHYCCQPPGTQSNGMFGGILR